MLSIEDMKKREAENAARRMASDAMLELMLNSGMPEEKKGGLRCIKAAREVNDAVDAVMEAYADPEKNVPYEIAMQAAEYLGLVRVGIDQFMQTMREQGKCQGAEREEKE